MTPSTAFAARPAEPSPGARPSDASVLAEAGGQAPNGPTVEPTVGLATGSRAEALVAAARARISRLDPRQAAALAAAGGLLVDTRPVAQRARFGEIPGAVVVERNVLEWRLDPDGGDHRLPEAGRDRPVVVLCQEGYASSLAVASLVDLGRPAVHDLIGGFAAWAAAGLPVRPIGAHPPVADPPLARPPLAGLVAPAFAEELRP